MIWSCGVTLRVGYTWGGTVSQGRTRAELRALVTGELVDLQMVAICIGHAAQNCCSNLHKVGIHC